MVVQYTKIHEKLVVFLFFFSFLALGHPPDSIFSSHSFSIAVQICLALVVESEEKGFVPNQGLDAFKS